MRTRRADPVPLMLGLIGMLIAVVVLWAGAFGPIPTHVVRIATPLCLMAIGAVGLLLSRP